MRRILDLVGAGGADLPFVDAHSARLHAHHLIGGDKRRRETGDVPIRPSTAWRERLSTRRMLTTALTATPLQMMYGYRPLF